MKVDVLILAICVMHVVRRTESYYHNSGSSSYQSSGGSSYYYSHSHDPCPAYTDLSAGLHLSYNDTNYPEQAIADEIATLPASFDCLLALPPAPPLPVDPTLHFAPQSCPTVWHELRTFKRNDATCWLVKDFKEPIFFAKCSTVSCQVCDSFFSTNGIESRCIPQYVYLSVWAFCEDLPPGNQIIRERIPVPVSFSCKKIQCANPWWWKRR